MNVLYVTADSPSERNSVIWRCEFPAAAINKVPGHGAKLVEIVGWVEGKYRAETDWADVIVIQRNIMAGALTESLSMMARGKKVFVDLDDGYDYMPQSVVSVRFWKNHRFHANPNDQVGEALEFDPMEHLLWGARICSGVTAPTQVILDDRKRTGARNTVLIPNYPVTKPYLEAAHARKREDGAPLTIGWAGGGTHTESFIDSGVMPALERVLANRKNVRFMLMGGTEEIYRRFRLQNIDHKPWVKYEQYHDNLTLLDIGLAPLAGLYDRRRSWLKAVEYGLMGIPWVGTRYDDEGEQPYKLWPDFTVRNRTKFWEERLFDLIDNYANWRVRMAEEQALMMELDIHLNVESILEAYDKAES